MKQALNRILVCALLCLPGLAHADPLLIRVEPPDADKRAVSNTHWSVFLEGDIDPGAAERVRQELTPIGDDGADVYLDSPGGSLLDGVRIGDLLRTMGATTIIGKREARSSTIAPGKCFSACSMAFIGGLYRYIPDGSLFGVHRAYSSIHSDQDFDAGQILAAQILNYIRDMGVNSRLFARMASVGRDGIYIPDSAELHALHIVNDGKQPAEWSSDFSAQGPSLMGSQQTADGTGKVIFDCEKGVVVLHSIYLAGNNAAAISSGQWIHSLLVDDTALPLDAPKSIDDANGYLNASFALAADQTRRIVGASSVGHSMQGGRSDPATLGYRIGIDANAAKKVRGFMESCTTQH